MAPVLFEIGPFTLHSYGLLVALGFLIGVVWSVRLAPRYGLNPTDIQDLCFYLVLAALIGSRLWFVGIAWDHYQNNLLNIFKIWEGGLVFYGGLIFAIFTAIVFMGVKRMPMFRTGDLIAPGLALGQAVGRIGCLAAGCCYGAHSDLPWAITFNHEKSLAPLNVSLHPAQLYATLGLLCIFIILILIQRRRSFDGQIFWTYGLLHGLFRPFLETVRGDFRGPSVAAGLTSTQLASLSLALVSAVILLFLAVKKRRSVRG